jgi:hypothetical protein
MVEWGRGRNHRKPMNIVYKTEAEDREILLKEVTLYHALLEAVSQSLHLPSSLVQPHKHQYLM